MELEKVEEKLSNMKFDDIVKSYCNKLNDIERLKEKVPVKGALVFDSTDDLSDFIQNRLGFSYTDIRCEDESHFQIEIEDAYLNHKDR